VCMFFAFPSASNEDVTKARKVSTFERALKLFATVSGRRDYTDPGEKFENVTLMLFEPATGKRRKPTFQLFDARSRKLTTEDDYFLTLRQIYNDRNPHAQVGEEEIEDT